MPFHSNRSLIRLLLLLCCSLFAAASAHAQTGYHVHLDVSALKGRGTYAIEFQLLDSSGNGDGNATAVVSNVTLNGGALGSVLLPTFGNVATNLLDSSQKPIPPELKYTLTFLDGLGSNNGVADFAQQFSITGNGGAIDFDVQCTATSTDAGFPDSFAILLLDAGGIPLPTNGPFGSEIVEADYTTTMPTPIAYATTGTPAVSATVTVAAPGLSSLALSVPNITATFPLTGTVKLNAAATGSGQVVTLSSDLPGIASVPASVTVPAGLSSATFPITTGLVPADTTVTIQATLGSVTRTAALIVQPLLVSLTLDRSAFPGSGTVTGTVTLRQAPTISSVSIALSSGYPLAANVPASVLVPVGQTGATFPITTQDIGAVTDILLHASDGRATQTIPLRILPAPLYTLTDLGTLGGQSSAATGVNNAGQAVGYSDMANGDIRAFVYRGGAAHDLGTLGGRNSRANALNAEMVIAGTSDYSFGSVRGALYNPPQFPVVLNTLGGQNSNAYAVNGFGLIAGGAQAVNSDFHAYLVLTTGPHDLGTLGGQNSSASGVNSAGQAVGSSQTATGDTHAFLFKGSKLADLGTLGGQTSAAFAINDSGDIAGFSDTANGDTHGFLYHNGIMTDAGTLPTAQRSYLYALNAYGQAVGKAVTPTGDELALLDNAGTLFDLNTRVTNPGGWTLTTAAGINERGQIVGSGTNLSSDTHGYLLTPVAPANVGLRTVSGMVTLTGCLHPAQAITFAFRTPDDTPLFTQNYTLNADGSFTLVGIPSGTYRLAVKGSKWLRSVVPISTVGGNVSGLALTLSGGDGVSDNVVDIGDFGVLVNAYNSDASLPGSGYDSSADFNCDGIVDIGDFGILVNNYNLSGDN